MPLLILALNTFDFSQTGQIFNKYFDLFNNFYVYKLFLTDCS